MAKGVYVVLALVGTAAAAVMLWPKTAKAASKGPIPDGEGPIDEGKPVNPQNADEAYSLGTNPQMTDPEYVHQLALWLSSSGQDPARAATLEKRSQDLRAEQVLAEGLKSSTTLDQVEAKARMLQPTHPDYAAVLATRIAVERGAAPPAPFMLPLQSGGSIRLDMSVYSSPARGGNVPVGPSQGGTTSLPAVVSPSAVAPSATPPPSVPKPASPQLPAVQPPPVPSGAGGVVAVPKATGAPQQAATPAPLAAVEVEPQNDPNGTIALARAMLEEQARPGWKYISQSVRDWQTRVGLTADGKFGPGSALRMAQEVGVLPWIRYWPLGGTGTKEGNVANYRSRLKAYAFSIAPKSDAYRTLAASLLISADRETGQGWPAKASTSAPAAAITPEQLEQAIAMLPAQLKR